MLHKIEFNWPQLLATDFDNTYALTSELAPNGMNVATAYEVAISKVFGAAALETYKASGGLRNRAPSEVVAYLTPSLDADEQTQRTEDLVEVKLSQLIKQVGQKDANGEVWPRVAPGFREFWHSVAGSPNINTAVISSGHQVFIERFHEVHELKSADIMLTDDDTRPLLAYLPPELCTKPSRLLMEWVHIQWMKRQGLPNTPLSTSLGQIAYAGDDPTKDGQLAANYGVRFFHINPNNPLPGWQAIKSSFPTDYLPEAA